MHTPEQRPNDLPEQDSALLVQAAESRSNKIEPLQRTVIEHALYADELRQAAAHLTAYLHVHGQTMDPGLYHLLQQKKALLQESASLNEVFNRNDTYATETEVPVDPIMEDIQRRLQLNTGNLYAVNEKLAAAYPGAAADIAAFMQEQLHPFGNLGNTAN